MTNDTTTTTMTPTRTEEPTREERTKEARALHPSVHPQTAAALRRLYLAAHGRARCAYGHLGPVARKHHERGYAEGRHEVALQILDAMIALLQVDRPEFHRGDVLQMMYWIAGEG